MILTNDIYIPIPKTRNTQARILINGADMTSRIYESEWVEPATISVGTFKLKVVNTSGIYSSIFSGGQAVLFYADNTDGTTLQFWGRIDYIKEVLGQEGQFLEIEGRHRSYLLSEIKVCYIGTGDHATILKNIITQYAPGFTSVNVQNTGKTANVAWNYKVFWNCVQDLCYDSGFDCYVDDNLDFHFFLSDSIMNNVDAISEGDNFMSTQEFGTDTYYERTRATAVGQDSSGLPIVWTAISPGEGTDIREVFIEDNSANTLDVVKSLANSLLAQYTNRPPQASIISTGLTTVQPGDNIWVAVPRQKIYGIYKVLQTKHKFGRDGWKTECNIEKELIGTAEMISQGIKKQTLLTNVENVNKLNYSYNFPYDDDTLTASHSSTKVSGGFLMLVDGSATTGTWIGKIFVAAQNITKIELRVAGTDIGSSLFYFTVNNTANWEIFTAPNTMQVPAYIGLSITAKITLNKDSQNATPKIDSIVLLYS